MGIHPIIGVNYRKMEKDNLVKVLLVDNSKEVTGAYRSITSFIEQLKTSIDFYFAVPKGIWTIDKKEKSTVYQFSFVEVQKNWKLLFYFPHLIVNLYKAQIIIKREKIKIVHINDLYNMLGICLKIIDPSICLIYHIRLRRTSYVKPLYGPWVWLINKFANSIILVSETVRKDTRLKGEHVVRIYDGISTCGKVDTVESTGAVRFLYVGNYVAGKGQDYALEAIKLIYARRKDLIVRFVGHTGGLQKNDDYLDALKKFVQRHELQKCVEFIEGDNNINDHMTWCDVVLNFSESESFSVVCLEALVNKRPVIATRCGGPEEIIRHRVNGILVNNRDVKDMADAMFKLTAEVDTRARLAENSQLDLSDKFNIELLAKSLKSVYLKEC